MEFKHAKCMIVPNVITLEPLQYFQYMIMFNVDDSGTPSN